MIRKAAHTVLCVLISLVAVSAATAQEQGSGGGNLGAKETVLRVLQLSQELEKLLASLPPETQETLRGQLIDRLAAPDRQLADGEPDDRPSDGASETADGQVADAAEAIAVQPAPERELDVRPAPKVDAEVAEAEAIEPASTHQTIEPAPAPEPSRREPAGPEASRAVSRRAPADETTRTERLPTPPPPTPAPAPSRRGGCRTAEPFDSDGDGKLTGLDRYWRHLYLWTDVDEDGSVDEKELESPYERGIREIDVDLRSFVRGKGKRKRALDIQLERYILLDVGGDGWSGDPRGDDGALAIDASAIRDDGGPDLRDERGRLVEGIRPFEPGWRIRVDGDEIVANCPRD